MHTLDKLIARMRERRPDFEIRFKDEKLPLWLRPVFWFQGLITDGFWERYTTAVGSHIYFPSREVYEADKARAFATLAHEFVHMHDSAELGRVQFAMRYTFPQLPVGLLGVLGVLGLIYAPLYALFGLAIALAPWPAPWRTKYEKRGYRMTILVMTMMGQPIDAEHIVKQFVSKQYYWMNRDEDAIRAWVSDEVLSARANLANITTFDRPYRDVHDVYYEFRGKK